MAPQHIPVLLESVLTLFAPTPESTLLDATVGLGGHAAEYLTRAAPGGRVVGFDADPVALAEAQARLAKYGEKVTLINANFSSLKDSIEGGGILPQEFSHVLFDLGIGSHQLSDSSRGFSFQSEGTLTMRYGQHELPAAALESLNHLAQTLHRIPDVRDLLAELSVRELTEVLRYYGEERYALRIASALKAAAVPTTAQELAGLIAAALPKGYERGRINPATRTFQALRLAVNRELEVLQAALPQAFDLLSPHGILAVISFHSLEDRIVKQYFRELAKVCVCPPEQPQCTCERHARATVLTKKPIRATEEEVRANPRATPAKLRALQKER